LNVLVCGGAGYIGSHACRWLARQGHSVTVLDNLSTGHVAAVQWGELLRADLREPTQVDAAFSGRGFDAVMHFAASSLVGESVEKPLEYYCNNVVGSLNLLQAMQVHGVRRLVFSSTAAVFGIPRDERIAEDHPLAPINPYGASKAMVERLIADSSAAWGLRAVALRYFNAAGATPSGELGEKHTPETHLIPNVLQACRGAAAKLQVFGDDWPTPDGTCVRDFVHVDDLAQAHALALAWMDQNAGFNAFNLGNGRGFSVREVISAAEAVVGRPVPFAVAPRRAGDPAMLVASGELAKAVLGWAPCYVSLPEIVETAWNWHRSPAF
jgi:UDP-glucose 4-epimerase